MSASEKERSLLSVALSGRHDLSASAREPEPRGYPAAAAMAPSRAASAETAGFAVESIAPGRRRVRLSGRLDPVAVERLWRPLLAQVQPGPDAIEVDCGEVTYADTTGIALIVALATEQRRAGGTLRVERFPEEFAALLANLQDQDLPAAGERQRPRNVFARTGRATAELAGDLLELVRFVGAIAEAVVRALLRPRRLRLGIVLQQATEVGVMALPVVLLIGFLIGSVLGFQAAVTLRNYGADVFLGRFVGLSMMRELGALMTAIVLIARSGSAFAAEIGTMKVQQEIDALTVMAIDPLRYLVVPRILATVFVMPILTGFSILAGIIGAALVSVTTLNLPLNIYWNSVIESLDLGDVLGGLAKPPVFGVIVAAVGCIRGLQTVGAATGVGRSTTSSVVSGVILLAFADSGFSILYYHLDI
jgi:phospholipid/cholesterol/gamma-HCH transport system permease protein